MKPIQGLTFLDSCPHCGAVPQERIGETANRRNGEIAAIVVAALFIFLGWLLFGCAHQPVTAPSTAGVQGSITGAQKYNDIAVTHNAAAQTRVQRIEAKAAVLQRYWK